MTKLIGTTSKGEDVHEVTLAAGDLTITLITLGVAVTDVRLAGVNHSLTLGGGHIADYEGEMRHHGTLIGPIANRISTARVRIEGMVYELERNQDGRIHLHSGAQGTHRQVWQLGEITDTSATFHITLPDGICGLPGNRKITATYQIEAPATLSLAITGTTDATTLMNFANHSYWNLDGGESLAGHRLQIAADHYLPSTADDFPTGEVAEVGGTQMDFRQERVVAPIDPPLDNNFCLSDDDEPLRDVLTLTGQSGLSMTVSTTALGIQVYDARDALRPGRAAYEGLAIEAQGWPDAPTNPHFPTIKVTPDAPYRQETRWRFSSPDRSNS
ncbi:MAG: aldose epimerase family protein [Pseudomonadota bacterium]